MLAPLRNSKTVSAISSMTVASRPYFRRYRSSPRGDLVVSNTGCPYSLCPMHVLAVVCTSSAYPCFQLPCSFLGLIGTPIAFSRPARGHPNVTRTDIEPCSNRVQQIWKNPERPDPHYLLPRNGFTLGTLAS